MSTDLAQWYSVLNLVMHLKYVTDFYAGRPHIHTLAFLVGHYLEVGMCVSYLEVVVCVYGYLTWRVVYTYIIMCIYHVGYTYTHI